MTTDSEIIRRSLDHPRAFAELFERHARVVHAFAARRVGRDAADDVLSETFLVAFRRRSSFDPRWDSAKPWLLGISSRLMKKLRSKEAAQWRSIEASAHREDHVTGDDFAAAADRVDAAASVRVLAPRIAALAGRDRDTLLLYAWGELTYVEIGRALGVPTGTVRSRLNRVRRQLAGGPPHNEESAEYMEGGAVDGSVGSRS